MELIFEIEDRATFDNVAREFKGLEHNFSNLEEFKNKLKQYANFDECTALPISDKSFETIFRNGDIVIKNKTITVNSITGSNYDVTVPEFISFIISFGFSPVDFKVRGDEGFVKFSYTRGVIKSSSGFKKRLKKATEKELQEQEKEKQLYHTIKENIEQGREFHRFLSEQYQDRILTYVLADEVGNDDIYKKMIKEHIGVVSEKLPRIVQKIENSRISLSYNIKNRKYTKKLKRPINDVDQEIFKHIQLTLQQKYKQNIYIERDDQILYSIVIPKKYEIMIWKARQYYREVVRDKNS